LGDRLQLLHKTPVDDVPLALCEFQGKLLVGKFQANSLADSLFLLLAAATLSFSSSLCLVCPVSPPLLFPSDYTHTGTSPKGFAPHQSCGLVSLELPYEGLELSLLFLLPSVFFSSTLSLSLALSLLLLLFSSTLSLAATAAATAALSFSSSLRLVCPVSPPLLFPSDYTHTGTSPKGFAPHQSCGLVSLELPYEGLELSLLLLLPSVFFSSTLSLSLLLLLLLLLSLSLLLCVLSVLYLLLSSSPLITHILAPVRRGLPPINRVD
jgi:hypothetical protein